VPVVACALFWTVSAINVINFMDGIDGLIGGTMVVYALHAWHFARDASAQSFAAALAGASAGFVVWNWSPARIFMGDVGSGALGVMLTVAAALAVAGTSPWSVVAVLLPLAPLFLDATVTLFRRWRRGERLSQAHRSHLYQRLANGRFGHAWTSTVYIAAAALAAVAARFDVKGILLYALALVLGGASLERVAVRSR
jgi:UDP-N-acetylmuramyl pentapeptide phosphotransferase/UDP-N-acetylglucosamine-1-phosphate transferase